MTPADALVGVVNDDPSVREAVASLLRSDGLRVETFASARELLARPVAETPVCLVLDIDLPGMTGLELQHELSERERRVPIIFLTGHGSISLCVKAVKAGAIHFLTKPHQADELLFAVREALALQAGVQEPPPGYLVGESGALQAVLRHIRTVADTAATVLITRGRAEPARSSLRAPSTSGARGVSNR